MKKFFCFGLVLCVLLAAAGCAREENPIVGEWEAEVQVSVLGVEEENRTLPAVYRFAFRADGTGESGVEAAGQPSVKESFAYTQVENALELTYESGLVQTYAMSFSGEKLILDGRVKLELNRVK